MAAQSSPTPWTFVREAREPGWHLYISDANNRIVTHMPTFLPQSARDEANYRLIVDTVNAGAFEMDADAIERYVLKLVGQQEAIVLGRLRREATEAELEALQALQHAEVAIRLAAGLIRIAERKAAAVLE